MALNSVIPSGAERSEVQSRDLSLLRWRQERSLDYAARRAASLGMTAFFVEWECHWAEGEG